MRRFPGDNLIEFNQATRPPSNGSFIRMGRRRDVKIDASRKIEYEIGGSNDLSLKFNNGHDGSSVANDGYSRFELAEYRSVIDEVSPVLLLTATRGFKTRSICREVIGRPLCGSSFQEFTG